MSKALLIRLCLLIYLLIYLVPIANSKTLYNINIIIVIDIIINT